MLLDTSLELIHPNWCIAALDQHSHIEILRSIKLYIYLVLLYNNIIEFVYSLPGNPAKKGEEEL